MGSYEDREKLEWKVLRSYNVLSIEIPIKPNLSSEETGPGGLFVNFCFFAQDGEKH